MDDRLIDFLLEAKANTYAAHGAETAPSRPNSHDLRFAKGDLLYLDTYLGGLKFTGEEALWQDGIPVWSMNYSGRVLGTGFEGDFLKRALLLVPRDAPFRGPTQYNEDEMQYRSHMEGSVEWFQGYEEILLNGARIYECYYHGGSIQ
jgi:hypothetical protein